MRDGSVAMRWEPKRFADIVGQRQAIEALRNYVKKPALRPNALLFSGPPGVGKTTTARVLSRALNCERYEDDVCVQCQLCVYGGPFTGTLLEVDGSVDRGVEAMKGVRGWAESSFRVSCSVVLIDEAHALTPDAWNALLKSLEDGRQVLWILATNFPERLPEAVRSRSTHMPFVPATAEEMRPALHEVCEVEELRLTEDQIEMAIASSPGAMRDALKNLVSLDAGLSLDSTSEDLVRRVVTVAKQGNVGVGVRLLSQRMKETRDARRVFDEVVETLAQALRDGHKYEASLGLLLARLADQRTGVARNLDDQTAVRLLPNLIWLAHSGAGEAAPGRDPQPESSGTTPKAMGCPTPTPPWVGKGGRPYGGEPCGRVSCPWCGREKAEDLRTAIRLTRPPVRVSLTMPPWTRDAPDKRMDRVLSKFRVSLHCWYEREVLQDGRIVIDCWMRPKDQDCELTECEFKKALGKLVEHTDVQWSLLGPSEDFEDFLSELRSCWSLSEDEIRAALKSWVARNGAQLIHASHEFFLDKAGRPRSKKDARQAVAVE